MGKENTYARMLSEKKKQPGCKIYSTSDYQEWQYLLKFQHAFTFLVSMVYY